MIDAYDTAACPSNTDCGLQFVVQITDAIVASGVSEFGRIRTLTDRLACALHLPLATSTTRCRRCPTEASVANAGAIAAKRSHCTAVEDAIYGTIPYICLVVRPHFCTNRFPAWLALAAILVVLPYLVNPV
jgi:hypothetical protein